MSEETGKYEVLPDDLRVKKELSKLNRLFKTIPKDRKSLVQKLIENAAFLAVLLDDLQEDIKTNGYKEKYQNGPNQYGFKRSTAADLYQVALKNYHQVIKELCNHLPDNEFKENEDVFLNFVNSRQDY